MQTPICVKAASRAATTPVGFPTAGGLPVRTIAFTLSGAPESITIDKTRKLLEVLRDDLGLAGTKGGCGEAVRSCVLSARRSRMPQNIAPETG